MAKYAMTKLQGQINRESESLFKSLDSIIHSCLTLHVPIVTL